MGIKKNQETENIAKIFLFKTSVTQNYWLRKIDKVNRINGENIVLKLLW